MKEFIKLILNKRFRQIVTLFILFFIQFWWLNKQKKFLSNEKIESNYQELYKKQARAFTNLAINLGGLLIKLGQFFSSRVDLLPKEYTDELAKLQDAVTPVATQQIKERLSREFSKDLNLLFASFNDEPLAAASLGQVHEAELLKGTKVAVKVLRPGIEEVIDIDLEALKVLILFGKRIERVKNLWDLDEVYLEFLDTVTDELDYVKEGKHADAFRENFKEEKLIYVPQIYWELTTSKVITMEYLEGIKVNDYSRLNANNIDRNAIAERLLSAYLKQILVDGFFHADPHPGNLLIQQDGTLVFLDFGMMGQVSPKMKSDMVDLVMGFIKKDAGAVVEAFSELGFLRPHAERSIMLKSIQLMLDRFYGDVKAVDFNEFSLELREFLYSQPFQVPARTVFLGKALNTLIGLCYGLDEEFDLVETAKPYISENVFGETTDSSGNFIFDEAKNTLLELVALPRKLNRLVDGLESGDLRLQVSRSLEERLTQQQGFFTDKIVKAVLSTGFLISGTNLLAGEFQNIGMGLILGSALLSLLLLRKQKPARRARRARTGAGPGFKKPKMHP